MLVDSLIEQGEGSRVDYKREWYKKDDYKGELVKDIVSLANGGLDTVGQSGYLLIGIHDKDKAVFDFDKSLIQSIEVLCKQVLSIINSFVEPSLPGLELSWEKEGQVLLFEVPPHDYLIYLSKPLEKTKHPYKAGTAFYRVGEGIEVVSPPIVKSFDDAFEKLRHDPLHSKKKLHDDLQSLKNYYKFFHYESKKVDYIRKLNFLHFIADTFSENGTAKLNGFAGLLVGNKLEEFRALNLEKLEFEMEDLIDEALKVSAFSYEALNNIKVSMNFDFPDLVHKLKVIDAHQKVFSKKARSILESRSSLHQRKGWEVVWFLLRKSRDETDLLDYDKACIELCKEIDLLQADIARCS